jgi:adenine deaminase
MQQLTEVALGKTEADLAIAGADVVNVYTGEIRANCNVLIKGKRIAYVGQSGEKSIGKSTQVIDAAGKTLIPGLIDGHTHIDGMFSVSEWVRYAMLGGTTAIVTEISYIGPALGYEAVRYFLRVIKNQPVKIFITVPPEGTISPPVEQHGTSVNELRKLFRQPEVIGLGELFWGQVVDGNSRLLGLIAETINAGRRVEGHSAGARDDKLQAYIATGISSCHEPITAEEVIERLRLGLFVLVREGEVRKELEAIARIKDEDIDFRQLAFCSDGMDARELITEGYMESIVQKAINLGFDPVTAIKMASLNVAQHFGLADAIGGIAPGKYADIVIVPDVRTIKAECVISNGRVVARNGQLITLPRRQNYPKFILNSIHLPKEFTAEDFLVHTTGQQAKVRVIEQVTGLVTRETIIDMPVSDGLLHIDTSRDILKIAAIDRHYLEGKYFVGFIRGIGLREGVVATSAAWDCSDIIVVGADEPDMAQAVNRLKILGGGIVVCVGGRIIAELPLPVAGLISREPVDKIANKLSEIQQISDDLGGKVPNIRLTLAVLTTPAIPFLRICNHGLFDLKQNHFVSLIVT